VVKNLLLLTHAILLARRTNLHIVKDRIGALLQAKQGKPHSHYKRLIRFFNRAKPDPLTLHILEWAFRLLNGKVKYLILDSTCWEIGQKRVHLQVLCILYNDTAMAWKDHDGHSGSGERKQLLTQAAKQVDWKGKILLADREYTRDDWLPHLMSLEIDFVVGLPQRCNKKQLPSLVCTRRR
jgi:hypothetical protein